MAHDTTRSLPNVDALLAAMAERLRMHLAKAGIDDPLLVGVHTGGVWLAQGLHARIGAKSPIGTLDISFHRDDFASAGLNPVVRPSHLPWPIEGRDLVLVDDVLYTGRTVRAAVNELFDWGRPRTIALAVLVARDGRELPVQADVVGAELVLGRGRSVKLRGPDPLRLEIEGGDAP